MKLSDYAKKAVGNIYGLRKYKKQIVEDIELSGVSEQGPLGSFVQILTSGFICVIQNLCRDVAVLGLYILFYAYVYFW